MADEPLDIILRYFPDLTARQKEQYAMLGALYSEWNDKINVISRKDIDNLYERHVLHSLAIAKYVSFRPGTQLLDVGTGGGFPGIPLAIMFPECSFHLIDSIGKKIRVATEVAETIGLTNVRLSHLNVKDERQRYDFVVSRAVMTAPELARLTRKNIERQGHNAIPNGILCLKGGDLSDELRALNRWHELTPLSDYFGEEFFQTKKLLYIPL